MATTDRSTDAASALELESAGFVRVIARPDGDALAASGVLARALADCAIPFQVSVASTVQERTVRATGDGGREDELTLVVGPADAPPDRVEHLETADRPVSLLACELARDLGAKPDPVLALAGSFAAGVEPGAGETELLLESASERDLVTRRGGVAIPTDDFADGVAHTTACRGPWSGDLEAAREAVAALESTDDTGTEIDARRLASLVALDVVGCADATTRAATAVGRLLRPYETPEGPFETIGGYADVLEATARNAPGIGVALAMGTGTDRTLEAALECWREHGLRTHAALDTASTKRYDGLFVVGVDAGAGADAGLDTDNGTLESVARLTADYRSPEPVVLAVGPGTAAIATLDGRELERELEAIARDLESELTLESGVDYDVGATGGTLRFGSGRSGDESTIIEAVRRVL